MKIVQASKLDSIDDYAIAEVAKPSPRDHDVVIKVVTCGMGYVDALVALGRYQVKPPTPFTPGQEVGGIVDSVGENVSNVQVGDRVMANTFGGGLAEYVLAPSAQAQRIPDKLSFAQAAGFRVNYVTALHGLMDRATVRAGERLLVFGAAGGVGVAAVQLGRMLGAEVIAAASTEEKQAYALAAGANAVIDTHPDGWRDRLKKLCGGKGPDVIFDPVTGPLFEPAFRSLTWGGRHLVVGFAGGPIPSLPINLTLMKGAALVGVDVRQFFLFEPLRAQMHIEQLLEWVGEGKLSPPIGRCFAFADFAEAMQYAISGMGMGKTVIEVAAS
jgi:NADPH:quinone reductase